MLVGGAVKILHLYAATSNNRRDYLLNYRVFIILILFIVMASFSQTNLTAKRPPIVVLNLKSYYVPPV
jgi:hypothetical protein